MKNTLPATMLATVLLAASLPSSATGLATCDPGDRSTGQPAATREAQLKAKGRTVRRIKEDGGCGEVYAFDDKGQRGEFHVHPVTLQPVPTRPR